MNYILFDDHSRHNLLPFTYTRPVADIRFGILTIKEKWERDLKSLCSYETQEYLSAKFGKTVTGDNFFINGKICPDEMLLTAIAELKPESGLCHNDELIAFRTKEGKFDVAHALSHAVAYSADYLCIRHPWDIFSKNGEAIKRDFAVITKGKTSQPLSSTNTVIGNSTDVFLEEGAVVEAAIINTRNGPVYIGKDAEIMEASVVRGPFALCEHAALKMATKVYGPTTIGPHSKVGGEVNNSVVFGFSNKAHDGFLGNSVLGEWCNLGADTNNSNLKNNYGNVKLYNYASGNMQDTGLQFCGLMMGDHSKCGINTMFNTGTVVGVGANVFGGGFPPTHIPSFAWGGAETMEEYKFDKMIETANRVYARRSLTVSDQEREILENVFEQTAKYRNF